MRSIKMVWAIVGITIFIVSSDIRAQDEDWFDKGRKLLGQKQYDDAIEAFSTAIEIIPRDYQSLNYRGVCWALKDDFHRAIADYSKAIEIRPTYAEPYNNRGFAFIHSQSSISFISSILRPRNRHRRTRKWATRASCRCCCRVVTWTTRS